MQIGYYNLTVLIILILAITFLLNLLLSKLENHIKKIYLPSIVTLIVGILFLINQYAWKWPLINPYLINVPNITGDYVASVEIGHLDNLKRERVNGAKATIRQTGTSIDLDFYSPQGSHSIFILSGLKQLNGLWYLYGYYSNENNQSVSNRNRYDGATKCEVNITDDSTKISGIFFNDETRKSYGTIQLIKRNK